MLRSAPVCGGFKGKQRGTPKPVGKRKTPKCVCVCVCEWTGSELLLVCVGQTIVLGAQGDHL